MKKAIIACILFSTCLYTSLAANNKTFKGVVVDIYGTPVKDIAINVRGESFLFPDNKFTLNVREGDTLKIELDGAVVKDTVLTDTATYHVIKVKPPMFNTGGNYDSSPAKFLEDRFSLENFVALNLRYPADALQNSISGVAHVRFRVNAEGGMEDLVVRPSVSPSLDQEAIRLVRLMPKLKTKPKLEGNHYIPLYSFIPIRFNLKAYLNSQNTDTKSGSTNQPQRSNDWIYDKTEYLPEFPGGVSKLREFLYKNIEYPSDMEKGNKTNVVDIQFVVDTTGAISNISVLHGLTSSLNEAAIQVVQKMPKWVPANIQGKVVSTWFTLPVGFGLNKKYEAESNEIDSTKQIAMDFRRDRLKEKAGDSEAFVVVEHMPVFPGGIEQMFKFLSNNVIYPKDAQIKGITGMVILSFVIDKTGKIEDITILRSLYPSMDEEAIRVVQKMPLWTPGKQKGVNVPVKFTLPIRYSLR